ncbi:MAG: hemolysin family protein [Planctomycetota bacterium]
MILYHLLAMVILLGLSAFFSASETALFSLSRRDFRRLDRSPSLIHGLIQKLRGDPQSLLTTVLFGNMLVNVLYFSVATVATIRSESPAIRYALGPVSLVGVIICGEVVPKAVAVAMPLGYSRLAAIPLFAFRQIIYPVRRVLGVVLKLSAMLTRNRAAQTYVTREELQLLIRATSERGEIDRTERDMMQEIVEFAEIRVREVMVPRVDVIAFEINGTADELQRLVEETGITKLPVYEENIDNIVGILHARDVLLSDKTVPEALRPVSLFIPEVARIEAALQQFRQRHSQFAIVVDEYGGWAGIVTLEDIVEEIVGEISDEFDGTEEPVRQIGPDRYVLSGSVGIRDWSELFGLNLELELAEVETLAGFIVLRLGRLPREGDTLDLANLRFTVQKVEQRRVARVLVERINGEIDEGEAT